jgi:hypothetical protein
MKRILVLVSILALSLVASGVLLAQQDSLFVGTWKLNVAKSKFTGSQPPKSETRTEVAQGDGCKVTYEGIAGMAVRFRGVIRPISTARMHRFLASAQMGQTP